MQYYSYSVISYREGWFIKEAIEEFNGKRRRRMMLLKIGRLLLYFLSSFGYWEYFRKKSGMNIYFLPAFTVSLQIMILFLAGILNCLQITVFFMFGIGVVLAVYELVRDVKGIVSTYLKVGYIFLAVGIGAMLLATRGQLFIHYDNFSHWALAVRNIIDSDRYPSFRDALIQFQAYPLGSASYIYYFAKIVSRTEGMQMFAQAYMMLCFILPVFKYVKKYKAVSCVYVFLFTNYLFVYNTAITDLLVDTLLPLQGMAMLFFIGSECTGFCRGDGKGVVPIWYAVPFLCTAVQIKNSGIYFIIIAEVFLFISLKCCEMRRKQTFAVMVAPFVSIFLWKAHCDYVFSAAASSKHAMTIENYQAVFSSKTWDEIKNIFFGVLEHSVTGRRLYFLLAFLLALGILSVLIGSGTGKKYLKTVAAVAGLYVTYTIGMFLLYLFSMPGWEAGTLAGIGRYQNTIFVAIYYLIIAVSLMNFSVIKDTKTEWIYMAVILGVMLISWKEVKGSFATVFDSREYEDSERAWFQRAIKENHVIGGKKYIVCIPGEDSGYIYYLCRYLLSSHQVSVRIIQEGSQMNDFQESDYIFIYDEENEYIQEWIQKRYPEQEGNSVVIVK